MSEARAVDAVEVLMPQMGESLSEGTIVKWLKQPGDQVAHDEPLFELSTDKVDTEVPAPAAGVLAKILVREGETVSIGVPVAIIEREGARSAAAATPAAAAPPAAAKTPAPSTTEEPGGHFKSTHAAQLVSFRRAGAERSRAKERPAAPATNRAFTPAVLSEAQRGGVSLAQLTRMSGSGRGGRVTKRDVQRFIESGGAAASFATAAPVSFVAMPGQRPASGPPPEFIYRPTEGDRVEPMSIVRKRIARHMRWSVRISPHASAQSEADMSAVSSVMGRRDHFLAEHGVPLTYTVFAAAATVRALRDFPVLNSSVVGDQIVFKPSVNLGIAVALADTDELIVPVVRRADELSLVGLAKAIHGLATRARARQLRPEDVQGGTFTLTNPGIFGGITGMPLLNQPQVGILSLGAVRKQPVVIDDAIAVRPIMALSLTFDHRATDGMVAFKFLARVRELLEVLPEDWKWSGRLSAKEED